VVGLRALGDVHGWVSVAVEHEGGAFSDVAMCCRAGIEPSRTEVEVYGPSGTLSIDAREGVGPESFLEVARRFAAAAGGDDTASAGLDVHRGLHLQRLVAEVEAQLGRRP
jgi:hypothetical protein